MSTAPSPFPYAERARILKMQNYRCAVCRGAIGLVSGSAPFAQANCDVKGALRGLLCPNCHHALQLLGESPQVYRNAANYLERHMPVKVVDEKTSGTKDVLKTISDRRSFSSDAARSRYASQYAEKIQRLLKRK